MLRQRATPIRGGSRPNLPPRLRTPPQPHPLGLWTTDPELVLEQVTEEHLRIDKVGIQCGSLDKEFVHSLDAI